MADKSIFLFVTTFLFGYCSAGFVELPSSITVEYESGVDRTVVFRCRHEESLASVVWELNGTSSRAYPDVVDSFVREDGIRVDTLTVPVIPTYNRTEVVCSTTVNGVTEETPAALLIITVESITTPRVTTPSPTSTPSSTTTTVDTPSAVEFDMPPSPLTMAVEEGVATFYCQHKTCDIIDWRVNGSSLNRRSLTNISRSTNKAGDAQVYSLLIGTLLEYNMTRVECVATFFDGSPPQFTPNVTLLIQGIPSKVKSASCKRNHTSGDHLITEWDPLPSLNLTNADPGIVYKVQWWKITCGQNVPMGEETVIGHSTSRVINQPHEIYKVIIIPKNNVPLAEDGEITVIEEQFLSLDTHLVNLARSFSTAFKDNSPVPSYYTMVLKSLDGTQSDSTVNITVQREGESIELRLERQLPSKTLWNVSVLAHNCEADTVLEGFELSTHDIQSVETHSPQPGTIRVTSSFIEKGNATDALFVVYPVSNNSNVQYIVGSPTEGSMDVTINVSTGGDYKVSVFALENGRPFSRVVALPRHVHVDGPNEQELQQNSLINYEVQPTSFGVCVNCTFLESSPTDCVAVVHQRISQLNSSGLMNIKSSHKFTRSDDTASGCIEGVNLEDYQVGIIAITQTISPTTNSLDPVPGIVGGMVTTALAVLLVVVVLSLVLFMRSNKKNEKENETKTESGLPSAAGCSCVRCGSFTIGTVIGCFVPQCITSNSDATAPDVEAGLASPNLESPPPVPERTQESNILIEQEQVFEDPPVAMESSNTTTDTVPANPLYDTPQLPDSSNVPQPQGATPAKSPWEAATSHSQFSSNHSGSQQLPSDSASCTAKVDSLYAVPAKSHKKSSPCPSSQKTNVGNSHTNTGSPPSTSTGTGGSTYADLDVYRKHPTVSCPQATETVQYDEIHRFQNSNGQHYAMIGEMPTSNLVLDDLQKTVYSEIKQPQAGATPPTGGKLLEVNSCGGEEQCHPTSHSTATVCRTFNLDHLFSYLLPVLSKWQSLGKALSLDEDIIDEIYTNNETDEECLRDMLRRRLMRTDLKLSWEEINEALKKVNESGGETEEKCDHQPSLLQSSFVENNARIPEKELTYHAQSVEAHLREQQTGGAHPSEQQTGGAHPSEQQTGGAHPREQQTGGAHPSEQQTGGAHPREQQTGGAQVEQTGGAHPREQQTAGAKEEQTTGQQEYQKQNTPDGLCVDEKSVSVSFSSHVSECSENSASNTSLCVKANSLPPKDVGKESGERTGQSAHTPNIESQHTSSPLRFSSMPRTPMPRTTIVCQETQHDEVDYLSAPKVMLPSPIARTSCTDAPPIARTSCTDAPPIARTSCTDAPPIARTSYTDAPPIARTSYTDEEADQPTQNYTICLGTQEHSYRIPPPATSYETKFCNIERALECRMHSDDEKDKGNDVCIPSESQSSRTCTSCRTKLKQMKNIHQSLCWRIMQLFYPYYLIGLLYKLCSQLLVQLSYLRLCTQANGTSRCTVHCIQSLLLYHC